MPKGSTVIIQSPRHKSPSPELSLFSVSLIYTVIILLLLVISDQTFHKLTQPSLLSPLFSHQNMMKKEPSKYIPAIVLNKKQTTTMYIQYNLNFNIYLYMEKRERSVPFYFHYSSVGLLIFFRTGMALIVTGRLASLKFIFPIPTTLPSFPLSCFI